MATEFSATTDAMGTVILRTENGSANANYTSCWLPEQIEDYGLELICMMTEQAMWRAHRAWLRSTQGLGV